MTTPFYEVLGEGPTCLFPAPTGAAWYRATLPPQLFAQLRVVLIEPSGTGRSKGDPATATVSSVVNDLELVRRDIAALPRRSSSSVTPPMASSLSYTPPHMRASPRA